MGTIKKEEFLSIVSQMARHDPKRADEMMRQYQSEGRIEKPKRKVTDGRTMTKPEKLWMMRLIADRAAGRIIKFGYEPFKIPLGYRCGYTPDFFVELSDDKVRIDECKGEYCRDDARIKIKWVAQKFPEWEVRICKLMNDGQWRFEVIPSIEEVKNEYRKYRLA